MKALIIVDLQNDFCPGGALPVPGGDEIVPVINSLLSRFSLVAATRDWHPAGHISFASSHDKNPGEVIETENGTQMLWPVHCVQSGSGANFHPDMNTGKLKMILHKGMNPELDSYSTFFENDKKTTTGLSAYLRGMGVTENYICGLAADYCVYYSALDSIREGFSTTVISDAIRAVNVPPGNRDKTLSHMKDSGIKIITSSEIKHV